MLRVPKPALSILAGLVVVFASACSSTAASPGVGGTSGPAGASAVAANPNDPNSIITQVLASGTAAKSFHIKIEVNGTIKAAGLQSAGSAAAGLKGDLKLDGTAIEGDVDVANQAAHLSLNLPPMAALGNAPLTGDLIVKDSALYYKISLLGPKYTKTDLGSLTSGLPVTVPSADPSALAGMGDEIAKMRQQLDAAGVKATLVGVEQIGGKDAYHISISIPLDKINTEIAAAAASEAPGMKIDSASFDIWTYKDTNQLAKIQIKGAASMLGNLDATITITKYGDPVTITAPAASDINAVTP